MDKQKRAVHLGKENIENANKKEGDPFNKIDRLLMIKRINHEEKDTRELREIRLMKNSKELRAISKSQKLKNQLKPIVELTNTQQYCLLYAANIIEQSQACGQVMGPFLNKHDIDKNLRARMLDWMIEVVSSYKFNAKTYFSSVYLMDRYFQAEETRLPITKLHIIGVISMLIATKMDEVYPLKVKTVFEKIVHKKIDKRELVEMEARIVEKLDFTLNIWSFYDLAVLKLHEKWQLKNQEVLKEIEQLCEYLGKFVVFNYQLFSHYDIATLSQSILKSSFKIYGPEKIKLSVGERASTLDLQVNKDCIVCMQLIMQSIKTFKSSFKNLSNIFKFSEPTCIERVEQYLRHF